MMHNKTIATPLTPRRRGEGGWKIIGIQSGYWFDMI